jgi:hypothetical protein
VSTVQVLRPGEKRREGWKGSNAVRRARLRTRAVDNRSTMIPVGARTPLEKMPTEIPIDFPAGLLEKEARATRDPEAKAELLALADRQRERQRLHATHDAPRRVRL